MKTSTFPTSLAAKLLFTGALVLGAFTPFAAVASASSTGTTQSGYSNSVRASATSSGVLSSSGTRHAQLTAIQVGADSDTATISGQVTVGVRGITFGQPILNACVALFKVVPQVSGSQTYDGYVNSTASAFTDAGGNWQFTHVPAGTYTFFIQAGSCINNGDVVSPTPVGNYSSQYFNGPVAKYGTQYLGFNSDGVDVAVATGLVNPSTSVGTIFQEKATRVTVAAGDNATGVNAALAAGGAISGRITTVNPTTKLVTGAQVCIRIDTVIPSNPVPPGIQNATNVIAFGYSIPTDADGNYVAAGLPAGQYYVFASNSHCSLPNGYAPNFNPGYYNSKDPSNWHQELLTPVQVNNGGATSGINMQLALAGSITGTITNATGMGAANAPLNNVCAEVGQFDQNGQFMNLFNARDLSGTDDYFGSTNASGVYNITGIPAGKYVVEFLNNSCGSNVPHPYTGNYGGAQVSVTNGADQFYSGVVGGASSTGTSSSSSLQPTLITVNAGTPTTGVNAIIQAGGGSISGTIANGAGGFVVLTDTSTSNPLIFQAQTNDTGDFSITNLPIDSANNFVLSFMGGDGTVGTEYYDSALCAASGPCMTPLNSQATPIQATTGGVTLPGSTALAKTGSFGVSVTISGGGGAPAPNVCVTLTNQDAGLTTLTYSLVTDAFGQAGTNGIFPGHYVIKYSNCGSSSSYITEYYMITSPYVTTTLGFASLVQINAGNSNGIPPVTIGVASGTGTIIGTAYSATTAISSTSSTPITLGSNTTPTTFVLNVGPGLTYNANDYLELASSEGGFCGNSNTMPCAVYTQVVSYDASSGDLTLSTLNVGGANFGDIAPGSVFQGTSWFVLPYDGAYDDYDSTGGMPYPSTAPVFTISEDPNFNTPQLFAVQNLIDPSIYMVGTGNQSACSNGLCSLSVSVTSGGKYMATTDNVPTTNGNALLSIAHGLSFAPGEFVQVSSINNTGIAVGSVVSYNSSTGDFVMNVFDIKGSPSAGVAGLLTLVLNNTVYTSVPSGSIGSTLVVNVANSDMESGWLSNIQNGQLQTVELFALDGTGSVIGQVAENGYNQVAGTVTIHVTQVIGATSGIVGGTPSILTLGLAIGSEWMVRPITTIINTTTANGYFDTTARSITMTIPSHNGLNYQTGDQVTLQDIKPVASAGPDISCIVSAFTDANNVNGTLNVTCPSGTPIVGDGYIVRPISAAMVSVNAGILFDGTSANGDNGNPIIANATGLGVVGLTIDTGLSISQNQGVVLSDSSNNYIAGSVSSYNPGTGFLVVTPSSVSRTDGTKISNWNVTITGSAVANVCVSFIAADGAQPGGSTVTNDQGLYVMPGLAYDSNGYLIQFGNAANCDGSTADYAQTYFTVPDAPGTLSFTQGTPIILSSSNRVKIGVDSVLVSASSISGKLTNANSSLVVGVCVTLFSSAGDYRTTVTESDGSWTFSQVANGTYTVLLNSIDCGQVNPQKNQLASPYFDGTSSGTTKQSGAALVYVTNGSAIGLGSIAIANTAVLTGRAQDVTDSSKNSAGMAGVCVDVTSAADSSYLNEVITAADGSYSIGGIPTGTYIVTLSSNCGASTTFTTLVNSSQVITAGQTNTYDPSLSEGTPTPTVPVAPKTISATEPITSSLINGAALQWSPTQNTGGSPLSGYLIYAYNWTTHPNSTTPAQAENYSRPLIVPSTCGYTCNALIFGLIPGDVYVFSVQAVNSIGGIAPSASNSSAPTISNQVLPVGAELLNSAAAPAINNTATSPALNTGGNGSVSATSTGGSGSVAVAAYGTSNPTGGTAPAGASSFFDVGTSAGATFTGSTFQVCGLANGQSVYWFNPVTQAYVQASNQTAVSGGCSTVTVSASTTPSTSQLYGAVFSTATAPVVAPPSGGGGGGGFVAPMQPTITVPTSPGNAVATVSGTSVTITWTAPVATSTSSPVTGYVVSAQGTLNPITCTTTTALTCTISGLAAAPYTFSVIATSATGNSSAAQTNTVTVAAPTTTGTGTGTTTGTGTSSTGSGTTGSGGTTSVTPVASPVTKGAPAALSIKATSSVTGAVSIVLTKSPVPGTKAITSYQYSTGAGVWKTVYAVRGAFTIKGLKSGKTYAVQLRAVSAVGAGAASKPYSVKIK